MKSNRTLRNQYIGLVHGDIRRANFSPPRFSNANCKMYRGQIPNAAKMKRLPSWKQHEDT